jgi:ribose transport system substrate-binding protein
MPAKRGAWWAVALIAVAGAFWYRSHVLSEPPTRLVRIAMVNAGTGGFWELVSAGAHAAASQDNIDLKVQAPADNENVEQQTALVEGLDLKAIDGVAISPLDGEGQTPIIDRIAGKAVVVTFDSDAPQSARVSYIGTSNVQAGRRAARLTLEAIPQGGKVVVAIANQTKENMIERRSGFDEVMKQRAAAREADATAPAYEVVDYLVDEGNDQRGRELLKQTIDAHPDLACVVGMNAQQGPRILKVLKDEQKLGKIAVVAFDEESETLAGVESGEIYATVVQDPYQYGYETVRKLASLCRSDDVVLPRKGSYSSLNIATISVTKDTLPEFRKQLGGRLAPTGDAAAKDKR